MGTTGRESGPDPRSPSSGRFVRIGQSIGRCLTNSSCWAVSVLVLCLLSAAFLVQNIVLDLERHRSAVEDRVLWNIAQAELELSALELAITHSLLDENPGSLAQVRRAYDIFYSRVRTFEEGDTYGDLRRDPSFVEGMALVRDYLDRTTAVIDAPDATLIAALGELHVETDAIRDPVRQMALDTVRNRTVYADAIRDTLVATLLRLGGIATLLILALLFSTIIVLRLSRSAEERARRIGETKTRIEAILTRTNRGVITVDGNGTVTDFNRAAEQMFGIGAADVLERHLEDVPIDEAMKDAIYRLMIPVGEPGSGMVERLVGRLTHARRSNGDLFPVEVSMSAIDGPTGRGVLVWIADIGARLQRERELNEALESAVAGETAKARMLNLMSHEIRTPLNGLVGALQVLGDTTLTPRQEKIVGAMQTSCDILMSHVNSVLDISQIDAGRLECAQDPFDLEEVARQVHDNQIHAARKARNHLIVENAIAGSATYLGDAQKIRQVLINLVSNATKFTQDGEIRLRLSEAPSGEVTIEVSDSGIGIAPEHHERIFQDFVTIDASYERNAGGTGLGLPLCRRLARMMGGSLTVQSAIGAGSTFCLTLPLAPAPSAEVAAADTAAPPVTAGAGDGQAPSGKPLRILVAEDNLINLEILTDMLTGDGHSVTSARDGEAAARLAEAEAFDIILMDISMPLLTARMRRAQSVRAMGHAGMCRSSP
ncbi:ATP-binding protein [Albidovulum sediminis]|uniref:histidine kinase n=1 Tax=Albidovulum sediminis TaxID=3066345 RepID=A0ABT2NK37_9RHOB|nr:ATP-binding protein [Defluviimonas sediminis]MCT8329274.1 ATP-binding protein [Defluviimonas sediminis]